MEGAVMRATVTNLVAACADFVAATTSCDSGAFGSSSDDDWVMVLTLFTKSEVAWATLLASSTSR